jgi:dTDP-4-amino-4,6-dideoxygalactose transaminase
MGGTEWQYVKDAFDSNWIAPAGPHITTFENNLSKISQDYHIAALSSGTSAIHLALLLLGIKRADELRKFHYLMQQYDNPEKFLINYSQM